MVFNLKFPDLGRAEIFAGKMEKAMLFGKYLNVEELIIVQKVL
jgi:hypothetical protein